MPGRVKQLANELAPLLYQFEEVRSNHTLVIKRLGGLTQPQARIAQIRQDLAGTPPFSIRVAEIETFERPPSGPAPVCYLAVESPQLQSLHTDLCASFGTVDGLEGDQYVPHITLARNGPSRAVERLTQYDFEPITWTADELVVWDARHQEPIEPITLPV